ncbi:hypothetical protein QWZ17_12695 [Mucilaginibacter flavus]|nr:hypothetical protein [Mucilaginibacter flavus]
MKKLIIFSVSLIACFFIGIAIDLACGPEADPYDYYVSFFHNDIQRTQEYKSFYFTGYKFLYDDDEQVSEAAINSREWAAYLGHDVKPVDVEKVMYKLGGKTDSVLYEGYLNGKGKLPDSLSNNTFLKTLPANKSALGYYRFAKSVEPIANITSYDYWNPQPRDTTSLMQAGNEALQTALIQKDSFIKLRYLYQAQRLLHYAGNAKAAIDVYDKYLDAYKGESHIKGWALALKAGEERRLKDTTKAAWLFAKVFAGYPERRVQAYRNYNLMSVTQADVLELAANNNEKAAITAITAFNKPGYDINGLTDLYQFAPSSDMIGVLLIREINKLEEQHLSGTGINSYSSPGMKAQQVAAKKAADTHMAALNLFCNKVWADKKYAEYPLARLAQAYMAWMQKDVVNGNKYIADLNNEKLSIKLNDQKQIIALLLKAQGALQLNSVNEDGLLASLKWLNEKVSRETAGTEAEISSWNYYGQHPFAQTARNFYQQVLAPIYLKQKDTSKAALAMMMADAYDPKNPQVGEETRMFFQQLRSSPLIKIAAWQKSPPNTAYLKFLTQKLGVLKNDFVYELLGTAYLREHKYNEAFSALNQVSDKTLNKFPSNYYDDTDVSADPFLSRLADYPKVMHEKNAKGYNKRQFAQAMAGFQKLMKSDPKNAATYYFTYATALYNTSTYGNAWYLISYDWSSTDYGRESQNYYDADYIKCTNAEKVFLQAKQLSANADFKAKCTFMAAKCRQKQIRLPSYSYLIGNDYTKMDAAEKQYAIGVRNNFYFTDLQKNYSQTPFYKTAVNECSYFRDFIAAGKKK